MATADGEGRGMIEPQTPERPSWRNSPNITIHPTAEWFPLLPEDGLTALAEDIKANRLREKAAVITKDSRQLVIDGRNRLDALERAGFCIVDDCGRLLKDVCIDLTAGGDLDLVDPTKVNAFIISKNIHRRHLTADQKRELIERLLDANPERSDRAIAKLAHVDHKTVAAVRAEGEASGELPHIHPTDRVDAGGRKRARKTANEAAKDETAEAPKSRPATKEQPAPVIEPAPADQPEPAETAEAERRAEELREVYTGVSAEVPQVQKLYLELSDREQTYFWRWLKSQRSRTPEPELPFDAWLDQFKTRYASLTPVEQRQVEAAMGKAEKAARGQAAQDSKPKPEPEASAFDAALDITNDEDEPVLELQTEAVMGEAEPAQDESADPETSVEQLGDRVSRIVERFRALSADRQRWVLNNGRLHKPEDTINHIKKNDAWADVRDLLSAYVASSVTEQAAIREQLGAAPMVEEPELQVVAA